LLLTIEDFNKLMNTNLKAKDLKKSRDLFVFACATGLDMEK
jgi:hypothetical protein